MDQRPRLGDLVTPLSLFQRVARPDGSDADRQAARAELIRLYQPVVLGYLRWYVRGWPDRHHAAEDLTQEAMARFVAGRYDKHALNRSEQRNFRKFLRRVITNLAIDQVRQRRPEALPDDPAGADTAYDHVWNAEVIESVLARLRARPGGDDARRLLKAGLRYWLVTPNRSYAGMAADPGVIAAAGDGLDRDTVRLRFMATVRAFEAELTAEIRGWLLDPTDDQVAAEFADLKLSDFFLQFGEGGA